MHKINNNNKDIKLDLYNKKKKNQNMDIKNL